MQPIACAGTMALRSGDRAVRVTGIVLVLLLHGAVAAWLLQAPRSAGRQSPPHNAVAATLPGGSASATSSVARASPVKTELPPTPGPVQESKLAPADERGPGSQSTQSRSTVTQTSKHEVATKQAAQTRGDSMAEPRDKKPAPGLPADPTHRETTTSTASAARSPTTNKPAIAVPATAASDSVTKQASATTGSSSGPDGDSATPAATIAAGVNCQKPEYPKASRRLMEEGVVSLRFLVESDGRVINAEIEKSSGFSRLDEAARSALALCQFRPGQVSGAPVRSWARLNYSWKLR